MSPSASIRRTRRLRDRALELVVGGVRGEVDDRAGWRSDRQGVLKSDVAGVELGDAVDAHAQVLVGIAPDNRHVDWCGGRVRDAPDRCCRMAADHSVMAKPQKHRELERKGLGKG